MENDLDQRQRNVVVNAYEAKHAGSIEDGSEGEAEQREKVAADLGKSGGGGCVSRVGFVVGGGGCVSGVVGGCCWWWW